MTINGKLNASDARLHVISSSLLDGKGHIGGNCFVTTTISSNQNDGALNFENLTLDGGVSLIYQLNGNNQISSAFTADILNLDFSYDTDKITLLLSDADLFIGQTYTFFEFDRLDLLTLDMGIQSTDYNNHFQLGNGATGNFFVENNSLQVTITSIPEPSGIILLLSGITILCAYRIRKASS